MSDSVLDNNIKTPQQFVQIVGRNSQTSIKVCENINKIGVWLTLIGSGETEIRANFTDYDFIPQSLTGKLWVLEGKAELKPLPIKQQQAFAADNHIDTEESFEINTSKQIVLFEANGLVSLENKKSHYR